MNTSFKNPHFWLLYEKLYLEHDKANAVLPWVTEFSKDFEVVTKQNKHITPAEQVRDIHLNGLATNKIETENNNPCEIENYGEWYDQKFKQYKQEIGQLPENDLSNFKDRVFEYETTTLTFEFPLPLNCKLQLVLDIDFEDNGIPDEILFLIDEEGTKYQLGFWDSSHWHPYCLRFEELDTLENYWNTQPSIWQNNGQLAWALLAKFIGIDQKEHLKSINKKYASILKELEVDTITLQDELDIEATENFHYQDNTAWVKTQKGYEFICIEAPDYLNNLSEVERKKDWVKTLTYSFRKQNYAEVEDYTEFPFELWQEILNNLS